MADWPLACDLSVFSVEQRQRHDRLAARLFADLSDVRELPEGYAVPVPLHNWLDAAAFVTLERLCCPFLTFTLRLEPGEPRGWLEMGGSADIKALLRHEFGLG